MSRVGRSSGVRYRDLFRNREFSALFIADVSSRTGSQLGKFALAALVYNQTKSPGLTALTFAVSYLPGILGGPLLSTLADRWPRRPLLIACDLIRASLMAMIALVEMPILVALGLLLLVELVRVPFGAARMAMLSDILTGERFSVGNSLVGASQQAVQVFGFGVGAAVVTALGARVALLADTTSYALSACLLALFIRPRPAPQKEKGERPHLVRDAFAGVRVVRETGQLPTLFWLLFLGPTALATAEGLAIPYTDAMGADPRVAGLFLAATPLGSVLGFTIFGKLSHRRRDRLLIPCALTIGGCVAVVGLVPIPTVIMVALFVAGVALGHIAHVQASIVGLISTDVRGRVIGLGQTTLQIGQASALLLAGFVAQVTSIQGVLLYTGICASAAVFVVSSVGSPHASKHRADPRARRRERRRRRQAGRTSGRRLAQAALYYDYYEDQRATQRPAPAPVEAPPPPRLTPPAPPIQPARATRRPLFADEVAAPVANGQPREDFADTAPIPRVNGTPRMPAPNEHQPNGYAPNGHANGQHANGHQQNGYEPNGYQPNGYQPNGYQPNGYQLNGHPNGYPDSYPNGYPAEYPDDRAPDPYQPAPRQYSNRVV